MGTRGIISVTLPDGNVTNVPGGTSIAELAAGIGKSLSKLAIAGVVDDRLVDLSCKLEKDSIVRIIVLNSSEGLEILRHSTAHVMAGAVKELFPSAKVTIGPAVDDGVNGFYYDFDVEKSFTEQDLEEISKRMEEVIFQDVPFERMEVTREKARELFLAQDEQYKLELLDAIPTDQSVSLYKHGDFIDLCRGPHLPSTKRIKAFKLMSVAGAYWRGDASNKMLSRIYGVAFASKKELDKHLARIEEAKKRDHRLLGKQMDLFSFSQSVGGGLVLWHPNGARIRSIIEEFWRRSHRDYGYELVYTPHVGRADLWHTSGHLDFYSENMYSPMDVEGSPYYVKPMNCPFHIEIYKSGLKSYRDLPIRFAELGTVYRFEASGVLHGLMRVRGFTQDDAHIFCRQDQLNTEIRRCLQHTFYLLRAFGFEQFEIYLSTKPEKYVGADADWESATAALKKALDAEDLEYQLDPGEGVFYGPKIDIKIRDSLARTWQCTTIQIDFNLPQRFDVVYVDRENNRVRPFMVHRALLGSIERFFGVLLEHYAGRLPAWLAPVQAVVLPVSDKQNEFAHLVADRLSDKEIRVQVDDRSEKLGFRIRENRLQRVPYLLVVGQREVDDNGVSAKVGKGEDLGFLLLDQVVDKIVDDAAWPAPPKLKED